MPVHSFPIDYERLKITNETYKVQLLDALEDVAKLKVEVGLHGKIMGKIRDTVEVEEAMNIQLNGRLAEQETELERTAEEKTETRESIALLEAKKAKLEVRLERHRAPSILEFAQLKQDLNQTRRQVFIFSDRVSVQKADALKWKKEWKQTRLGLTRSAPGGGGGRMGQQNATSITRPERIRSAQGDLRGGSKEDKLPSKGTWRW